MTQPIAAVGSVYSPKFLELGGGAVEGVYTESSSSPATRGRRCRRSSQAFKAKYGEEPDAFNAVAYDTMILVAAVMRQFGTEPQGDPRRAAEDQGRAERNLWQDRPSTRRPAASPGAKHASSW